MAKRRKTHSRKRRRAVSAPKRRRRRVSGAATAPVIGRSRKRRRVHGAKRRHKRGRRMGAPGSSGVAEYLGLLLGTGVGLTVAEIATPMMGNAITPIGSSVVKGIASVTTFAIAKNMMRDNAFVKGVSIGFGGSAINDGLRALRANGVISGPGDVVMEVKVRNPHNKQLMPGQNDMPMVSGKRDAPVIGCSEVDEDWHYANVINE